MKVKISNSWLFPLRFIIYLALAYVIWVFTAPVGTRILADIGGGIVLLLDRADYTNDIKPYDEYIIIDHKHDGDDKPLTVEYRGFTFNLPFLVALIMMVPKVNYKLRFKILIIGMVIIFPIQVFKFVVYIFNYYCQNIRRRSGAFIYPAYLHHTIGYVDKVMWRIDGQIIPVLIWGGLYYYYKWHNVFTKLRKAEPRLDSPDKK
ncbi:MAG: hypothetical protein V3W18_01795 [candidate division Zixibacteria bacterium]